MDKLQKNQPADTEPKVGRRKLISLIAVGTVGAVTVATAGGVTFAREMSNHAPHHDGQAVKAWDPDHDHDNDKGRGHSGGDSDDDGMHPGKTPTPSKSPTPGKTPTPQQTPTPKPTTPPQPTATPTAASTGTVIGSTSQATNTAVAFTNPADGQASWLVHMGNGNFVAVEQACTHAGVAVKYNASTGQFNCPAHGAIFNADGTNPQAPATKPLPPVQIVVNANGTITTP